MTDPISYSRAAQPDRPTRRDGTLLLEVTSGPGPGSGSAPNFDRLARLASRSLRVPTAIIWALNERGQAVIKGQAGDAACLTSRFLGGELDRLVARTLATRSSLVVADVDESEQGPTSTTPELRSFLGCPLLGANQQVVGVLSVIGYQPRPWLPEDLDAICDLATCVEREFQGHRHLQEENRPSASLIEHYRVLSEHARDIVLLIRKDGRIVEANHAAEAAYGYRRDELIGLSVLALRSPLERSLVLEQIEAADARGIIFETIHRRKDSTSFPVEVSCRGADIDGERYLVSIIRDISERKHAEAELSQSREQLSEAFAQLEALVAGAPFALAFLDRELKFIRLNESMARLAGRTEAECPGRTYREVFEKNAEAITKDLLEVIETGRPRLGVYHEGAKRGLPDQVGRWLSNWYPVRAEDGRILGVGIMTAEITEQLRAEEALRYNERQYRTLIDGVLHLMWVNDAVGRAIFFNRRWTDYSGFVPDELTREGWRRVVEPSDMRRLHRIREEGIAAGEPYECEYRIRRHDGEYRWHIVRVVPVKDRDGVVESWFGTATDIHDLKQAEEALREARDAAEAGTKARDQFLAVLSHELRTPLTPVLVSATAMLDDPETPDPVRSALEVTKRNITLEARLIDDLLDITTITQGKLSLCYECVDAHELIHRASAICHDEVGRAGIGFSMQLDAKQTIVNGDPARLQQIFWNLIKNAVKFTPRGGLVSLKSYNEVGPTGPWLVVEVHDTGIGLSPNSIPRLFSAFEQGEREITRQFGGLGLGLAISRSLAEAHGGTLTAASEGLGHGATFRFKLPVDIVSQPAPAAPVTNRSRSVPPESLSILLVEDNTDTLRVVTRLLGEKGYHVLSASTFQQASAILDSGESFNLVVSDIGLPDGSGLELMHRIRACGNVKGIALSGYGREDDIEQSLSVGFSLHLTKPVDFASLEQAIQRVAQQDLESRSEP